MTPYVGEIRLFAGSFVPAHWHLCDGSLLAIGSFPSLFALLGTRYGGDGSDNFGLPNLQGIVPIGQGEGLGLAPRVVGQQGGSATIMLTQEHVPSHSHTFNSANELGTTATFGPTLMYAKVSPPIAQYFKDNAVASAAAFASAANTTIAESGQSAPHSNVMPVATMNYIIALDGIFPGNF